jgi:hypothetical protein
VNILLILQFILNLFIYAKHSMFLLPHGKDTFKNTPITLSWVGATIFCTLSVNLGTLVNWMFTVWNQPALIAMDRRHPDFEAIVELERFRTRIDGIPFPVDLESTQNPYQIWWWPIIAVLYYPLNFRTAFHFLTNMYILYSYSVQLERSIFKNIQSRFIFYRNVRKGFVFQLLFITVCSIAVGALFGIPFIMDVLSLSILSSWCQLNKGEEVNFWFGVKINTTFFPWIIFALNKTFEGGIYDFTDVSEFRDILGIMIGILENKL